MRLAGSEKIARYRASGHWGSDSLYQVFLQAVADHPGGDALLDPINRENIDGHEPQELDMEAVLRLVHWQAVRLHESGLRRGDIVVAQAPNVVELVVLYLACARLGLVISPLPVQYGEHEIRGVVEALRPKAFVGATLLGVGDLVKRAVPQLPPKVGRFTLNDEADGERISLLAEDGGRLSKAQQQTLDGLPQADPDACFTICWTSGTTGQPKGVPRSHNHWVAQGPGMYHGLGMTRGDRLLSPFPFTNMAAIGGTLMGWMLDRGTLILHHPFDLGVLLRQVSQQQPNVLLLPPAVLNMLLKDPTLSRSADLSGLLAIGSGSAPLSPWMVSEWQSRGVPIVNIFGSNEGAAFITDANDVPDPALRASCFPRFGQDSGDWANPISGTIESRLVGADGSIVTEPGKAGELYIRGPNVFEGYWGMTHEVHRQQGLFDDDGYFRSGDLFEICAEDPRLMRFVARSKDIIVRGGVNISMDEIDGLLADFPGLQEVASFIVPDDIMGERIGVAVVASGSRPPTLEELSGHLEAAGAAKFKRPEKLLVVDKLPRNPMNKVLRHRLTELYLRSSTESG